MAPSRIRAAPATARLAPAWAVAPAAQAKIDCTDLWWDEGDGEPGWIGSIRPLDDGIEAHWGADIGGSVERGRLSGVRQ